MTEVELQKQVLESEEFESFQGGTDTTKWKVAVTGCSVQRE
jgi:hypothetical protein